MSNFDFIRLPKELINKEYDDKIKYKDKTTIMPERVDRLFIGYEDWIKRFELPYDSKSMEIWRMVISASSIQTTFITPLLKSKYNAELFSVCGGGITGGCTYVCYVDIKNFEYLYFYTMNRWKRSCDKYYRIMIYRIPYAVYDMLRMQEIYETYLFQYPTGFRFRIMTHKQCMEDRTKYLKLSLNQNKEVKW